MSESPDNSIAQQAKKKLEDWKSSLEHFEEKLHITTDEVVDEFQEQKKHLVAWLDQVDDHLQNVVTHSEEKALDLKAKVDELRLQAALGKAETVEALDEQRKALDIKIHDIKHDVSQAYHQAGDDIKDLLDDVNGKLDDFQMRFDLLRLQAHLGKEEAKEIWEEKKQELSLKLHEVNTKLHQYKETATEKWEHFSSEMATAWSHFREAFK